MSAPVLQVALDIVQLARALEIAVEAVAGGADWVEAGTPLVKSEGMESVRALRKRFPGHEIVADLKTMDAGGAEVEMATKAGATIVTILGVSDDETIRDSLRSARQYGSRLMVDLIGVVDKPARAKALEAIGVDLLCHHVGIDQQMHALTGTGELRAVCEAVTIPVAAAGGLNSENVVEVLKAGARIVIVGGAITKAPSPTAAAKAIKEAMAEGAPVASDLYRKYPLARLREAFLKVSTPNIADAAHKKGAMVGLRPLLDPAPKMVGRAITVRTIDGDWAKTVEAIDKAQPGDVIVVDAQGGTTAVWGELASHSCLKKGVAGVVIDGAIRDVADIRKLGFPAYARHISPHAGEPKGYGEIGVEIHCGGQVVQNGDWIVGDDCGLVVVAQDRAVEIANRAIDVLERENRIREEIHRGSTLSKVLELYKWEKQQ